MYLLKLSRLYWILGLICTLFELNIIFFSSTTDPPVVKVSPSAITANTSEIVLLNCEYFANPASLTQVEW